MALTSTVMILIGARARRISAPHPIEVARYCFVISLPNSPSKGAKSVNNPFIRLPTSKFELPGAVALPAIAEAMVGENGIRDWNRDGVNCGGSNDFVVHA